MLYLNLTSEAGALPSVVNCALRRLLPVQVYKKTSKKRVGNYLLEIREKHISGITKTSEKSRIVLSVRLP